MQISIDGRPTVLAEVYGQPTVVKEVTKRLKDNNMPKASLFRGSTGVGKSTVSKIVAMSLVCDHLDAQGNPCGKCLHCKDIIHENYSMDVSVLDGSSESGKSAVVEFGKMSQMAPMYSKSSVYIIEEADQLSPSAKNSLLKVLEKPTENVYFILLSMVNGGIPKAIVDRCQVFKFSDFTTRDIMFGLKHTLEKLNLWGSPTIPSTFFTEGIRAIAEACGGSLRAGVQLLDKCVSGEFYAKDDIEEHLGVISSSTVNALLMDALHLRTDFFDKLDSMDIADSLNLAYNNLSDAIVYRLTNMAKNDYYEAETKAMANSERLLEVYTIVEEVLSTPIYMKNQLFSAKIAQYMLKHRK